MIHKPTHLDLFSGIGGLAIAAQANGYQTIGFRDRRKQTLFIDANLARSIANN